MVVLYVHHPVPPPLCGKHQLYPCEVQEACGSCVELDVVCADALPTKNAAAHNTPMSSGAMRRSESTCNITFEMNKNNEFVNSIPPHV